MYTGDPKFLKIPSKCKKNQLTILTKINKL